MEAKDPRAKPLKKVNGENHQHGKKKNEENQRTEFKKRVAW